MGRLDGEEVMLMPIGRFARASRLSVKSLRNYHDSGLLPAAFVDPQSGYRYYRLEQLARADAIRSLRMVQMPLPQIAETLDGDEPERLLTSHLVTLESQRDELQRKVTELQRRINLKEFVMTTEVTVKTYPAQTAATWRTETTYADIFTDIPAGFGRVLASLESAEVDPIGAPFTVFHQAPDGDTAGDISMCVPIASTPDTGEKIETIEIPEGAIASVLHRGPYEDMGAAHATAAAWIQKHGHTVTGPTREIYLNSPADVGEADLMTEIQFPIDAEGTN